jgi:hypothetical protein
LNDERNEDRRDIAESLRTERPNLVVDASGPFQDYGEHRYGVIEACIAARVGYVDFADAADFVFGVAALDESAKAGWRIRPLRGQQLSGADRRCPARDTAVRRGVAGAVKRKFATLERDPG